MQHHQQQQDPQLQDAAASNVQALPDADLRRRHGAIGKALLVWIGSGSFLAAVAAYFLFSAMGC